MADAPEGDGMWIRQHMLATAGPMATGRRPASAACRVASDLHRASLLRAFSDVSWNQCFGLQNHQVVLLHTKNHSK